MAGKSLAGLLRMLIIVALAFTAASLADTGSSGPTANITSQETLDKTNGSVLSAAYNPGTSSEYTSDEGADVIDEPSDPETTTDSTEISSTTILSTSVVTETSVSTISPNVSSPIAPSTTQVAVTETEGSTTTSTVNPVTGDISSPGITATEQTFITTESSVTPTQPSPTMNVTYEDSEGEGVSSPTFEHEPFEPSGMRTWAVVLVSVLLSFGAIFTILYFVRMALIRKRKADQRRLLRGSVSSEGYFYGDGDGNTNGKFEL